VRVEGALHELEGVGGHHSRGGGRRHPSQVFTRTGYGEGIELITDRSCY
jgi:hypothetical protein